MENINIITNEKEQVFGFTGKIDSANSEAIQEFVLPQLELSKEIIFDFDKVDYISSSGLRFILKVAKSTKEFKVINLSPAVYEIFEITGFTALVKVEKALREISIEGKELIGEGYIGRVYRLDPDTIAKVVYREYGLEDIKREIGLSKKAFVAGIPTAIPFDVVKVKEGGLGSVYELLKSECFNKLFINHPENEDQNIALYINLLKKIMVTKIDDPTLPRKIDEARLWVRELKDYDVFDKETLAKLEKLIETIPDVDNFVHGDYHIKNIMMEGNEPLLIDMDTIGCGHPIFEISAFFLTYIGYPSTEEGNTMMFLGIEDRLAKRLFNDTINEIYKDRSEEERKAIIDKVAILGYMWLAWKTIKFEPTNKERLYHSRDVVLSLIDKYETLDF